jgi:hypothetical protein
LGKQLLIQSRLRDQSRRIENFGLRPFRSRNWSTKCKILKHTKWKEKHERATKLSPTFGNKQLLNQFCHQSAKQVRQSSGFALTASQVKEKCGHKQSRSNR